MVDEATLSLAFPAAILATWIAIFVVLRGKALAREEEATGRTARSHRFVFGCIGFVAALYFLFDGYPLVNFLLSILGGMLIGGGVAYWLMRWLTSQPRDHQQ
jgi:hypothetical protein